MEYVRNTKQANVTLSNQSFVKAVTGLLFGREYAVHAVMENSDGVEKESNCQTQLLKNASSAIKNSLPNKISVPAEMTNFGF